MTLEEDYPLVQGNAVPHLPESVTPEEPVPNRPEIAPEPAVATHKPVDNQRVDISVSGAEHGVLKDSASDPSEMELDSDIFPDIPQTSQQLPQPVMKEPASAETPESLSAFMLSPGVRQVKVSPPLEGPSDKTPSIPDKAPIKQPIQEPVPQKAPSVESGNSMIGPGVRQVLSSVPLRGPGAETDSSVGSSSDASMLAPAVQQVRVSAPLEGPDSETAPPLPHFQHWTAEAPKAASEDSESSQLGPSVRQVKSSPPLRGPDNAPVIQEAVTPQDPEVALRLSFEAAMIAPAARQVRTSAPLQGPGSQKGPSLPPFQPWVSKEEKAPSVKSDSSRISPVVRQVRSAPPLKGPHSDTESSHESAPEPQPVQPVEALAPAALAQATTDSDVASSDGSIDLGNIGGPPQNLPSEIKVGVAAANEVLSRSIFRTDISAGWIYYTGI